MIKNIVPGFIISVLVLLCGCGVDKLSVSGQIDPPFPGFEPAGLVSDSEGNVLVTDQSSMEPLLMMFSPQHTPLTDIGMKSTETPLPLDVAIAPSGDLWVSIVDPPQLIQMDENGRISTRITHPDLFMPESLDVDEHGVLWVADSESNSVYKLSEDSKTLVKIDLGQETTLPKDILTAHGRIYIADYAQGMVKVFDARGQKVDEWHIDSGYPLKLGMSGSYLAVGVESPTDNGVVYKLVRYGIDGRVLDELKLEIESIDGITSAPGNRLYISSARSGKIIILQ